MLARMRGRDGGVSTTGVTAERGSFATAIAAAVKARVMAGDIPVGSWMRQETVAQEFGVSRTPVREAFRLLAATGVVELHPHRGVLVRGINLREFREAYEVRAELEGYAAELAARWILPEQREQLRDLEREGREIANAVTSHMGDVEQVRSSDRAFHALIQVCAGSDLLRRTIADLNLVVSQGLTWVAAGPQPALVRENVEQHGLILAAIERGDGAEARHLMAAHVRRSIEIISRTLSLPADEART